MKNTVFWDIMPCNPLNINRHVDGTFCFHYQCQRISWARNKTERRWQSKQTPWRWRRYVRSGGRLASNGLRALFLRHLYPKILLEWISYIKLTRSCEFKKKIFSFTCEISNTTDSWQPNSGFLKKHLILHSNTCLFLSHETERLLRSTYLKPVHTIEYFSFPDIIKVEW
jgi:hypothetical protein